MLVVLKCSTTCWFTQTPLLTDLQSLAHCCLDCCDLLLLQRVQLDLDVKQ